MEWTAEQIQALAARRGLTRLTPEHLARWLEIARAQPDTMALRRAVTHKDDAPEFGFLAPVPKDAPNSRS